MKKLNNKGVALVYTILTMLLVFAICMLITTVMLAQITYFSSYSAKSEQKYMYSQIGDLFVQAKGDFYSCEGSFTDDEAAKTTPFGKQLSSKFDISSLHVVPDEGTSDESDFSVRWEGIKHGETVLSLVLGKLRDDLTLVVYNRTNEKRAALKVTLNCTDKVHIVEWNRGE